MNKFLRVLAKKKEVPGFSALEGQKLTKQKIANWNKLSRHEQEQYLDAHPKSIFHRVGVTKKEDDHARPELDKAAGGGAGAPGGSGGAAGNSGDAAAPAGTGEGTEPAAPGGGEENPEVKTDEAPAATEPAAEPAPEGEQKPEPEGTAAPENPAAAPAEAPADSAAPAETPAPAPAEPLKTDENTGLPVSTATANDVREIETNIQELTQPGGLDKGSEPREAAAATIAEAGKELLNENLPPEKLEELKEGVREARNPTPMDDFDSEEELVDSPRRRRGGGGGGEGWKTAATIAGLLLIAGLVGGALFLAHPGLAMGFGIKFMENFESYYRMVRAQVLAGLEPTPQDEVDVFIMALAEYARQGDLPPDTLEKLNNHLADVRRMTQEG